ncbi:ABC transporter ATP-binding protein [Microbacterium capsulatum]|uniref:ABC transporter ATP-binding protein n=1 Tax=Microbacterium capsulatum TaxID=3041921 RepID=A0ABU0XLU1_9MICO|nr:ABC transporter ATP-binding protein [Microbacterium sp. ASV81]MDQ4214700.1 ABC transporter ATP-binding protein [Microbacterium sp. ASV81]
MIPAASGAVPLLSIENLSIHFETVRGTVSAVKDVTFQLEAGRRLAVVGESGSGKSTTASAVHRLLPPNAKVEGSIRLDGEEITTMSTSRILRLRGREVGYVPQDPLSNLNPVQRIGKQLMHAIRVGSPSLSHDELRTQAIDALDRVGIPQPARRIDQFPHEFSGGMRQRALIAMGMACRPRLLIADEPTSALDVTVQRRVLDLIDDLTREQGTALLFITHDLGLAAERADDVVVMKLGEVVERGTAEQVLSAPKGAYTRELLAAAPNLTSARLVDAAPPEAAPILELEAATKIFGHRTLTGKDNRIIAAEGVSLTVSPGETVAIVGESGSGKSTTARMILGLEVPTSGTVRFDGASLARLGHAGRFAYRAEVQPVFQNPYASLDPRFTIGQSIREPLDVHRRGTPAERKARVAELLGLVSLDPQVATRFPHELSGGQRQRVAIARALALSPKVIVLDEAVSALDVVVQAQILKLLVSLQRELGLAYIFVSHDLAVVRQISHRVHVMSAGRIVESGSPEELFAAPKDPYTAALIEAIPGYAVAPGV